ncbi:hypothetical protein MPH_09794 [Macrophomina phaseolina MS6]|uniref:Uncharacterized protein n=1 Tax=Macrophomina phaseolina (strain MS6) TaxID=1126212 RepID=K2RS65_MACPH|nr:hypothetical protein MPH_09794 [Macrophomina phaseolina MS6]
MDPTYPLRVCRAELHGCMRFEHVSAHHFASSKSQPTDDFPLQTPCAPPRLQFSPWHPKRPVPALTSTKKQQDRRRLALSERHRLRSLSCTSKYPPVYENQSVQSYWALDIAAFSGPAAVGTVSFVPINEFR